MSTSRVRFAAALIVALFLAAPFGSPSHARTWAVRVDGTGDLPTIQAAVEAAAVGDTVLVGPGQYNWVNQRTGDDFALIRLWKREPDGVVIRSEAGPQLTILDAMRQSRVLFANGDNAADPVDFVVEGFTITRGVAPPRDNRPEREGGGMAAHLVEAVFRNCIFLDNEAEYGGAIWVGGSTSFVFEDCRFEGNVGAVGGAVLVVNSSILQTRLERCVLVDNYASVDGGALLCWSCDTTLEDCLLVGNQADDDGSAIAAYGAHPLVLRGTTILENDAGVGSACLIREARDADGNLIGNSELIVEHSLIGFNVPGTGLRVLDGTKLDLRCTDIFGNPGGNWIGLLAPFLGVDGNVSTNPLYCDDHDRRSGGVCADSPLLAAVSGCEENMGQVSEACEACSPTPPPPPPGAGLVFHPTTPNPFPETTTARYDLPRMVPLRVTVHDLLGRLVKVLHDGPVPSTSGGIDWDGTDASGRRVASGVYLCRLDSEVGSAVQRMVLLR